MVAGKEWRVQQPHEVRYVVYIVYDGQQSSPMAWSDNFEYIQAQYEYLVDQGYQVRITDRDELT